MNDEEKEVDQSLGLFEAAIRGGRRDILMPEVKRVHAVLDGSDQDPVVRAVTESLAEQLKAEFEIVPMALSEGAEASDRCAEILRLSTGADLVVLPVPFGENIGSLRNESLSSVIDLALAELGKPMLLVRQTLDDVGFSLKNPVCLFEWHEDLQACVASWAARMVGPSAGLTMMVGQDPDLLDEVRAIFDDHEDDLATFERLLERAVTRLAGGLVSSLQHLATERGFSADFVNLGGTDVVRRVNGRCADDRNLAIAAYRQAASGPTASRVRELILGAEHPVLVLPC